MDKAIISAALRYFMTGMVMVFPLASTASNMAILTVKVTVSAPTCTINNEKPLEVDFGTMLTTDVDGSNNQREVLYTVNCNGNPSNALKLQVQGAAAPFDSKLLNTNKDGLGIRWLRVGGDLPVNTWLNFTYPTPPRLWVVPVREAGTTLTAGEFFASATMTVDYQ